MRNSRRAAAFAVVRWLRTKEFPSELLPEGADRAFVQDLVYTVIRRLRSLRSVLDQLVARWPKGELEALLYVGAAQILYMDEVPDFAAVNETVEAAKECGNPSVVKVVNGVLRNLIRQREKLSANLANATLAERESFPTQIVRRWIARFGEKDAERLCKYHNSPAETFLARRDGSFVALERGKKVTEVPGYNEGEFIVQDPATALAVGLLEVAPGDEILDACAAPGGKTVQIAWRGAKVTACEVNPRRRHTLEANLARVGLSGTVRVTDALPVAPSTFTKILVDAPCSNTGVFRRRPDARWNWSVEKLNQLIALQAEILDKCAALLPRGGTIVYSTCSNEEEENLGQVKSFLDCHPDFVLDKSGESLPFLSGHDGSFAARLVRK